MHLEFHALVEPLAVAATAFRHELLNHRRREVKAGGALSRTRAETGQGVQKRDGAVNILNIDTPEQTLLP